MAVVTSKAVDSSYWFMSSPVRPITNILVPSFENAMSCEPVSCDETLKGGETKVAVVTSKAVDSSYWFMSSPPPPTTNILVPSFENAMPCGPVSCDEMSKGGETKVAVVTSKAVDSSYWFMSFP